MVLVSETLLFLQFLLPRFHCFFGKWILAGTMKEEVFDDFVILCVRLLAIVTNIKVGKPAIEVLKHDTLELQHIPYFSR